MPATISPDSERPSELSRQHRAWIALYALEANEQTRADILRLNQVTEEDLTAFRASWLKMRRGAAPAAAPRPQAPDAGAE